LVVVKHCEAVKMEREEGNQKNAMMRFSPSLKLQLVQQRRRRLLASGDAAERQPGGVVSPGRQQSSLAVVGKTRAAA